MLQSTKVIFVQGISWFREICSICSFDPATHQNTNLHLARERCSAKHSIFSGIFFSVHC